MTDSATGAVLANVCVDVGVPPPSGYCWARTDSAGNYKIDLAAVSASPGTFDIYFLLTGYAKQAALGQHINGVIRVDYAMYH